MIWRDGDVFSRKLRGFLVKCVDQEEASLLKINVNKNV